MSVTNSLAASIASITIVICAGIVVTFSGDKAGGETYAHEVGTFQLIHVAERQGVWRINTSTGELKLCSSSGCSAVNTED